jgi:hypothetical protein
MAEGRDVSSDKRLLAMCRQLRHDYGFPIEAMMLADYITGRLADRRRRRK